MNKRIRYKILEYEELIDSSDITIQNWINIGNSIEENFYKYDSFVILHGTDTLAYSASVLSFMFSGINRTIIITGSQIPISEMRNDGAENLLGSLIIAGHYCIPELTVFFNK